MRVAFVAPLVTAIAEPQLGGSQALLADIASGLTARGHDVAVFAASGSSIDGTRVVDVGIDPAMLRATFFRATEDAGDFDITRDAFAHVYGLVRSHGADVVHNHAFDAPAIDLAPDEMPVVHTLHLPPMPTVAAAVDRAQRVHPRTTVACVSEHSAALWRSTVAVDIVLPNGVPVSRIPWSSDGGERVLFAGRFSPEKGAAEAIEIARRAGVPITLVGDPYDERYAAERIEPYRGSDGIEILHAMSRTRVWDLMRSSRAVLCPVSWDEPFGLVAAEANAAGTPVVAFDRGALPEVIVDGETGFVVRDVDEACRALSTADAIDRARCRAHAESKLDLARTLDAQEALYAQLAATTSGTR